MQLMAPFVATILGIPNIPSVTEVNVRAGAGTNQTLVFKIPLRVKATVQDVQPDVQGMALNGKPYQWFQLAFSNNQSGWVRDDLINVEGDGSKFGYPNIPQPVLAFSLTRQLVPVNTPSTGTTTIPSTTTPPTSTTPATTTTGKAQVIGRMQGGINVRSNPSPRYNPPIGRLDFNARAEVAIRPEENNASRFRWINILHNALNGWVREDLVRLDGDYEAFGLGKRDAYPAPLLNSWWIRDFNLDAAFDVVHKGWDFAAKVGEPILAGPNGGMVMRTLRCTRCTPGQPSAVDQGLGLNNNNVLNDPAWGYGYGHYVIARYLNQQLPESTRQTLASRNLNGAHIYTMYAHLNTIDCAEGQTLAPNQQLGTCGNTGNSTGAHLHLETRASANPNDFNWSGMQLLDPVVLFRR
jgi:murein DD-endopeptidase MepM/ murein hydrolase activator NlpD